MINMLNKSRVANTPDMLNCILYKYADFNIRHYFLTSLNS